jgi:hypothetical protein
MSHPWEGGWYSTLPICQRLLAWKSRHAVPETRLRLTPAEEDDPDTRLVLGWKGDYSELSSMVVDQVEK